jgi:hypothetical protein
VVDTSRGGVPGGTTEEVQEERVWRAGREDPMPIKELPEPPASLHILGPGMLLAALGVGLGETYLWPRLVILFGPEIRWLFFVGVTLQGVVMLEMARYATATGESIFFGAARLWRPIMWLFFAIAVLVYIWPGHVALGAQAFESLTGISWYVFGVIGLLLIGVIISFSTIVYNVVEAILSTLIGVLVIGSTIIAALVGNLGFVWATITGLFAFGYFPQEAVSGPQAAALFPLIVGAIAFAGPSGMQQMWYTLWLRDKGAGMGSYIPKIKGLTHMDEEESMPSRGFMFDTEDPGDMRRWKGWRRWVHFDAWVLFWGITMFTTIIYTVLAQSALQIDPGVREAILADDQGATLNGMAAAFAQAGGAVIGSLFYVFIAVIGWKMTFGIFDAFSRGQADMSFYFIGPLRRLGMNRLYFAFLWFLILFGIAMLFVTGEEDGPAAILDILAVLSTFAMGAYCLLLLGTNNLLLPKKIRPNIITNILLAFAALFYLGMLAYSYFRFGVIL